MIQYLFIFGGIIIAAVVVRLLFRWRRTASQRARDREQIDRKFKEDALDRALSNQRAGGGSSSSRAETPVEIRYKNSAKAETGTMVRLTELSESMSKEYLFQMSETIYLGEEFERAAVFKEKASSKIFCELFPYNSGFFVRKRGNAQCRLLRGKQSTGLTSESVRLHSGDRIETQAGVFLVEFI